MASPNVAGSLLLLQQYYNQLNSNFMRASTLKGLVCHSAVDAGSLGPDPNFGFGLLDTRESAIIIEKSINFNPTSIIQENILTNTSTFTIQVIVNDPQKLIATICWTDVPGISQNGQHNSTTPALVNNLDIRIFKGTEENFPWKLNYPSFFINSSKQDNNVDNVEKVEVNNASGTYIIQVTHKGTLTGGQQSYSLIVSGFDQAVLNNKDFNSNSFTIYPNPANDVLNIQLNNEMTGDIDYEIYDIAGKKVMNNQILNNSIDVSKLQGGMYFLRLVQNNQFITKKFIKN
jgi:hypothetical protein